MLARLLIVLVICCLTLFGIGCSSDSPEDGAKDSGQVAAQEGGGDAAELDAADDGGSVDTASAGEAGAGADDDLAGVEEEKADATVGVEKDDDEIADIDDADLDEEVGKTEEAPKDQAPPTDVAANEPPTDAAPPVEMSQAPAQETAAPTIDTQSSPGMISVKKIKTAAYKVGGVLANTVYLGRPGDTIESISQKIYGADRSDELLKINPNLKRGVKAGDKVYYNSPKRPTDDSKMITYYEDNGMQPMEYTAKDGENIRKVSKNLLGHEDAWKEVWATNDVDSKNELPSGTKLRYWTGTEVAAATPAPAPMAATPPPAAPTPPPTAEPPPPPDLVATNTDSSNSTPPPTPSAATVEPPPPPPPPAAEPPPPPAPIAKAPRSKPMGGAGDDSALGALMNDPQMLTYVGGGAVLVIGLLAILGVARKRRSRIDFGQTQV